jgi:hypothetical protein
LFEDYFYEDDDVDVVQDVAENAEEDVIGNANALYQWHNGIANAMWDDYVAHIMDNDN